MVLVPSVASAATLPSPTSIHIEKGIFYILDEKFIDNINDLPSSAPIATYGEQKIDNIHGWIQIVGWKNLSRENGKWYIRGSPESQAILMYDAEGRPKGNIAKFEKSVSLWQQGNNLIASLNVKMVWFILICDTTSCYPVFFKEEAMFQDIQPAPEQYPGTSALQVNLTQYNNSIYENIGIRISNVSNLQKYSIRYKNSTAVFRLKKAHVEQLSNGNYFANITTSEFVNLSGGNMSRYGNTLLLDGNLSEMVGGIDIVGSNLYDDAVVNKSQYGIYREEFRPEKELEKPLLFGFLSIVMALYLGVAYFSRRLIGEMQLEF